MLGIKIYKTELQTQEQLNHYSSVADWCNNNNATIEDKGEYYEVVPAPIHEDTVEDKIAKLRGELASTDYKCLKYVDGALSESEYAETKAYRAELREQINELEGSL